MNKQVFVFSFLLIQIILIKTESDSKTLCENISKLNSSDSEVRKEIEINLESLKTDTK